MDRCCDQLSTCWWKRDRTSVIGWSYNLNTMGQAKRSQQEMTGYTPLTGQSKSQRKLPVGLAWIMERVSINGRLPSILNHRHQPALSVESDTDRSPWQPRHLLCRALGQASASLEGVYCSCLSRHVSSLHRCHRLPSGHSLSLRKICPHSKA